ncbi:MAG: peptidoglycan bridge formation glycyltransferase FemA/FemB family protein [Patescibacteria group bacterium]
MLDIRQTPRYAKYLRKTGWQIEELSGVNCFIKKIPLLGSVIKIQRPETIPLKQIKELAKKHHAFQLIIEPKRKMDAEYLRKSGFKLINSPFLPSKTLILDLTVGREKLFKQLKKDARYALRKTEKLVVDKPKSITDFYNSWKKAVGKKRYITPLPRLKILKRVFGKNVLFLMNKNSSAGAIFLLGDKIAYYWQAFSGPEGRKQLAQYRIVWEGILWAKKSGAKIFDFEGIYDKRFPNKQWSGFTHFKKSFGGEDLEYPGCFSKIFISQIFKWKRNTKKS